MPYFSIWSRLFSLSPLKIIGLILWIGLHLVAALKIFAWSQGSPVFTTGPADDLLWLAPAFIALVSVMDFIARRSMPKISLTKLILAFVVAYAFLVLNSASNAGWYAAAVIGLWGVTRFFRKRPLKIGFVRSLLIVSILASITVQPISYGFAYLVQLATGAPGFFDNSLVIAVWGVFTIGLSALLFLHPAIHGKRRIAGREDFAIGGSSELTESLSETEKQLLAERQRIFSSQDEEKRMLPVPANFAVIFTWFNGRIKWLQGVEGATFVPYWLGVSVSNAPVSTTKVEKHDENGNSLGIEDRGYYRSLEMFGYVFIGRRTIQERVVVQSADTIPITVDVDDIISVENPVAWQGADNPYGTSIGRLEAALRIGVSNLKSRDVNLVRSLFPSLLKGCMLGLLKSRVNKNGVRRGDLIRTESGAVIFHKTGPFGSISDADAVEFANTANDTADADYKPAGGFTGAMVEKLTVYEERLALLKAYGCIGEGTSIRDVTLPKEIEEAYKQIEIEMAERESELIEATTAVLTAEKYAGILATPEGQKAAELALAERKGTIIYAMGSNPAAQLGALLNPQGGN